MPYKNVQSLQSQLEQRQLMLTVQLDAARSTLPSFKRPDDVAYLPYIRKLEGRIDEIEYLKHLLNGGKKPTAYA